MRPARTAGTARPRSTSAAPSGRTTSRAENRGLAPYGARPRFSGSASPETERPDPRRGLSSLVAFPGRSPHDELDRHHGLAPPRVGPLDELQRALGRERPKLLAVLSDRRQ